MLGVSIPVCLILPDVLVDKAVEPEGSTRFDGGLLGELFDGPSGGRRIKSRYFQIAFLC